MVYYTELWTFIQAFMDFLLDFFTEQPVGLCFYLFYGEHRMTPNTPNLSPPRGICQGLF